MGVYVSSMEMPETCKLCYLSEFSAGFYAYVCKPTGVRIDYEMAKVSKPKRICPLIEVPGPHGDLIDRDKLRAKEFIHDGDAYAVVMSRDIRNAPTIIPADESDMDSFIRVFGEDDEEDGMDSFIRILKD